MSSTELRGEASRLRIGTRWVGPQEPCFVIAEAGSNHNGRLEQANELIDAASEAGADAVKFQLFRASRMYVRDAGVSGYLKSPTPIYDIIRAMEMPDEWLPSLAARCRAKGMEFIATPFDEEAADALEPYVDAFKVASYELTHLPLVRAHRAEGQADDPVNRHRDARRGGRRRRSAVRRWQRRIRAAAVHGFVSGAGVDAQSQGHGHIERPLSGVGGLVGSLGGSDRRSACRGGARRNRDREAFHAEPDSSGPDHPFALEPRELKLMIEKIREVQCALGSGEKTVAPVKRSCTPSPGAASSRSVRSRSGETFTTDNLAVLRCGERQPGLPPSRFAAVVGRKASRAIRPESALQADDVRDE